MSILKMSILNIIEGFITTDKIVMSIKAGITKNNRKK